MGMSLSEIEEKAQELSGRLLEAGAAEAALISLQIEGLRDLAQIMQVGEQNEQWNVSVGLRTREVATAEAMRERELAAMEVVAAKVPEPVAAGQCFSPAPVAIGKPPYPVCTLKHGHFGAHGDGSGMSWTNADPSKCGYRWQWFGSSELQRFEICTLPIGHDGGHLNQVTGEVPEEPAPAGVAPCPSTFQRSKDEYYVCTLEYQHTGQHRGGGMWWSGPGNGKQDEIPKSIKPASDHLHELVSMWNGFSLEQDQWSRDGLRGNGDRRYAEGQAVAWGKAASMLQDILTEGGV